MLLITICSDLYSQDNSFKLYTSPLSALDYFSRPMVSLGGEFVFLKRLGFATEFGYKYRDNSKGDTSKTISGGYAYRFEMKYYDIHKFKKGSLRNYLSLEYRYIKDNHSESFTYHENSSSIDKIEDNYSVVQNIYIGNIKYGIIIGFGKRFYSDIYCGIGIRYRDVKNDFREYNPDLGHEPAYVDELFSQWGLEENSGLYPNLSLGLKLGIKF